MEVIEMGLRTCLCFCHSMETSVTAAARYDTYLLFTAIFQQFPAQYDMIAGYRKTGTGIPREWRKV
ncbi:hypothetical protein [Hungatella sp.]